MFRKILIVDDSALIQHMYGITLSRYRDAKILTASNGAEALDLLAQQGEVDLIILDINMPVMNGLEVLDRLRREPGYRQIPVLVITTDGREEDAKQCLSMGAKAFLRKPFKTPQLYKVIEEITGEKVQ